MSNCHSDASEEFGGIDDVRIGCDECPRFHEPCNTFRDLVLFLDADVRITWVNQPVPGMPKVKFLRRSAYEAIHEDHRERTRVIAERAIHEGQNEFLICRDIFRERYWMASLYPSFRGEVVLTAQIKPLCSVLFELSATQRCILYHLGRGWPITRNGSEGNQYGCLFHVFHADRPS